MTKNISDVICKKSLQKYLTDLAQKLFFRIAVEQIFFFYFPLAPICCYTFICKSRMSK